MEKQIDKQRAEYLVQTYADMILRLCCTYMGNTHDAQDICQNVLLKIMVSEREFRSVEHEKAFIIRATMNACKDGLRSVWWKRICGLEAAMDKAAPEPEGDGMLAMVQQLPKKYKEVIFLYYYEGYAVKEIAELIGQKPATVNTHLNRARQKLKSMMGGLDYESV